jgi:hypothetical protein
VIHGPDLEQAEVDSPDAAPDKAGLYYSKGAGGGLEASTLVPDGRRFIDKRPNLIPESPNQHDNRRAFLSP